MNESESSEEYNSEEEVNRYKWMPVKLPQDFDPNKVPTTGEEYLHYAMYEAKKYQTIVVANIDIEKFQANQTLSLNPADCPSVPKSMIPTQEWQEEQVRQFTRFRKYAISRLPRLSDKDDCLHYYWLERMNKEYPKFSTVSKFNSHAKLFLLELIIKELDKIKCGDTISDSMGCWIYSILSVLEVPLSPDLHAVLRELARKFILIRSKLSSNAAPDKYKPLNFFICIIARYFGQYDLADK